MLELAFRTERTGEAPLYRQLAEYLGELIGSGRLRPGEQLPATRELAAALGLSRNTVTRAYEALAASGALSAHVGQGTFVAARGALPGSAEDAGTARRALAWGGLLSLRARVLRVPSGLLPPEPDREIRFDFRPGRVDTEVLPIAALQRAFQRALGRDLPEQANAVDPLGFEPLRHEIARALVRRGIACTPEEVLVTGGAQQAIDLIARALIDPGDAVAIEQPGYFGAFLTFQACQAHLVGIGVDRDGLRTDELARLLRSRRLKLLYATPSVQMPTGVVMSPARREALLELADREQVPVLEDDYDGELRIGGRAHPALKTLDRAGQVAYVGTFSKALFPGVRIGYVVAARPLLAALSKLRLTASLSPPLIEQAALAEFLAQDGLERHVRRVRRLYAQRLRALLSSLEASLPGEARWVEPAGGNSVWVELPHRIDGAALHHAARDAGIAYAPGGVFCFDGGSRNALALSFATLAPEAIAEGIERFGALVRERCATRRPTPSPRSRDRARTRTVRRR